MDSVPYLDIERALQLLHDLKLGWPNILPFKIRLFGVKKEDT